MTTIVMIKVFALVFIGILAVLGVVLWEFIKQGAG